MNEIQLPGTAACLPYFEPLPNNERDILFYMLIVLGFLIIYVYGCFACVCRYVCAMTFMPGAQGHEEGKISAC